METNSTIERGRGRGPREYVYAAVAAAALIAVVVLATDRLGSYVAYEGEAVGGKRQPDTRVVAGVAERVAVADAATHARPINAPGAQRASVGDPGPVAGEDVAGPTAGDGAPSSGPPAGETGPGEGGGGGHSPPTTGEPPVTTGQPPTDVPPVSEPTAPEPTPVEVRPVPDPVPVPPAPEPEPSSVPAGPLTATTTGLEDTLGSLGVNLPITELTGPVTAPADQLLALLGGSAH